MSLILPVDGTIQLFFPIGPVLVDFWCADLKVYWIRHLDFTQTTRVISVTENKIQLNFISALSVKNNFFQLP